MRSITRRRLVVLKPPRATTNEKPLKPAVDTGFATDWFIGDSIGGQRTGRAFLRNSGDSRVDHLSYSTNEGRTESSYCGWTQECGYTNFAANEWFCF